MATHDLLYFCTLPGLRGGSLVVCTAGGVLLSRAQTLPPHSAGQHDLLESQSLSELHWNAGNLALQSTSSTTGH